MRQAAYRCDELKPGGHGSYGVDVLWNLSLGFCTHAGPEMQADLGSDPKCHPTIPSSGPRLTLRTK